MIWHPCPALALAQGFITALDEAYIQIWKSLEDLYGVALRRVEDIPMVDGVIRDETNARFTDPLPVYDILVHCSRLQLLLCRQIEGLNCSCLPQGDDVSVPVHDGTVCIDGAANDLIVVLEINDDDLWLVRFIELLSDANEVIRL